MPPTSSSIVILPPNTIYKVDANGITRFRHPYAELSLMCAFVTIPVSAYCYYLARARGFALTFECNRLIPEQMNVITLLLRA